MGLGFSWQSLGPLCERARIEIAGSADTAVEGRLFPKGPVWENRPVDFVRFIVIFGDSCSS